MCYIKSNTEKRKTVLQKNIASRIFENLQSEITRSYVINKVDCLADKKKFYLFFLRKIKKLHSFSQNFVSSFLKWRCFLLHTFCASFFTKITTAAESIFVTVMPRSHSKQNLWKMYYIIVEKWGILLHLLYLALLLATLVF